MTLDELDRWLDTYGRAWERKDVDGFVACFAPDADYYWGPWDEPLRGHDAIRAQTEEAVSHQANVRFGHELLGVTPDGRGLARWWVSMEVPAQQTSDELEGIFLVTLDDAGRCTDFREWFNHRSRPLTSSSS
jgi:hypothetical protein